VEARTLTWVGKSQATLWIGSSFGWTRSIHLQSNRTLFGSIL